MNRDCLLQLSELLCGLDSLDEITVYVQCFIEISVYGLEAMGTTFVL